jgi:hypothetical protein
MQWIASQHSCAPFTDFSHCTSMICPLLAHYQMTSTAYGVLFPLDVSRAWVNTEENVLISHTSFQLVSILAVPLYQWTTRDILGISQDSHPL